MDIKTAFGLNKSESIYNTDASPVLKGMTKVNTYGSAGSAGSNGSGDVRLRFTLNMHSGFLDINKVYRKENAQK